MQHTSDSVEALVEQFMKLPTIGRKTAQRLASFVLKMPRNEVADIAHALLAVKDQVNYCSVCYNVTEQDPCRICAAHNRDHGTICVVEEPSDVQAIERTGDYRGVYHILGGVISPLDGVGPDDLNVQALVNRIKLPDESALPDFPGQDVEVDEIILAVNPNVEGDTTAYYISQLLEPLGVTVTRIARGLPIGGDLEYADEATLSRAIEGRGDV